MESDNQCGEILDNVYLQIYELPVDVELLDNDFQQANFYGHCSSNGTTSTYQLVVCDAWLCTFTHGMGKGAHSIVMVEYIINLF